MREKISLELIISLAGHVTEKLQHIAESEIRIKWIYILDMRNNNIVLVSLLTTWFQGVSNLNSTWPSVSTQNMRSDR